MKKKALIIGGCVLAAAVIAGAGVFLYQRIRNSGSTGSGDGVYVDQISTITGSTTYGSETFTGVVESEKTTDFTAASDKTVKEIFVEEGQEVKTGDQLFSYDVDAMDLKLRQAQIEYDSITNKISTLNTQLTTLQAEKAKAAQTDQLSYTLQIESVELDIRTEEYNQTLKQNEIDTLKASIENAVVTSTVDGTVTAVNESGTDTSGNTLPLISIMGDNEYKVKGTVTELTIGSIAEGEEVTVISRVDASQTWHGVISKINREETASDTSTSYVDYGTSDSTTTASKYNFYVTVDDLNGLIIGQHVFIKTGDAGTESGEDSALMLPSYYLIDGDTENPAVYKENASGVLERTSLELGEYDEDTDSYEVLSGLTAEDYIAFPDSETTIEGQKALHYSDSFTTDDAETVEE